MTIIDSTPSIELALLRNRGYFTRAEAIAAGWGDRELAAALRRGELVRLRHGNYAPTDGVPSDEAERHRLLARIVVGAQRGEVALCGASAAVFWGLRTYREDLTQVHLLRVDGGSSRSETGVVHHVARHHASDLVELDGVLVTSVARTVWDVACQGPRESGLVTADSALGQTPGLRAELAELADQFAYVPGSRRARLTLALADGRSESHGETVTRLRFHQHNIPKPELQYEVFDEQGRLIGRSDFGWPEFRHLGEFDGKTKYRDFLRPGEDPSEVVFREKRREDQLRATRRGMSRFTWAGIEAPIVRRSMADLRAALVTSRRLYIL